MLGPHTFISSESKSGGVPSLVAGSDDSAAAAAAVVVVVVVDVSILSSVVLLLPPPIFTVCKMDCNNSVSTPGGRELASANAS